jgi:putative transposase
MERTPYPTDLSDRQWKRIGPMIPPAKRGGRPRVVDMREVVNAILYVVRGGCAWRLLPHDFPAWRTVYGYFVAFKQKGVWRRMHDALREQVRRAVGHQGSPSAAILDSQSVKTTEKGGLAAMTRARRSTAASGTSWSTRWA